MTTELKKLEDETLFGTTALILVLKHFGIDVLNWDPETIKLELKDLKVNINYKVFNRLMAAIGIVATDFYWRDLDSFVITCNALLSGSNSTLFEDPATVYEMAWSLIESNVLVKDQNIFDGKIKQYMIERLKFEGFLRPPKIFSITGIPMSLEIPAEATSNPDFVKLLYDKQKEKEEDLAAFSKDNLALLYDQITDLKI